ncbi:hypothetical protein GCM10010272_13680 [Streptomyces lateritius]|nr:hypothetical protein GCM10010272_13680 [Streptomyces lateritius]
MTFESGTQFDASRDRGEPFKFALGGGRVIKGMDRGVRGMRAGGRREIVIPPRLGYGKEPPSPLIPPHSTLVFVVDLLDSYSRTDGWSRAARPEMGRLPRDRRGAVTCGCPAPSRTRGGDARRAAL